MALIGTVEYAEDYQFSHDWCADCGAYGEVDMGGQCYVCATGAGRLAHA